MEAIYIPQLLKAPKQQEQIEIDSHLADLETLTPVRGTMVVKHCSNYLEVEAQGETIITLTCDRCLQQYNHRLSVNTSELIWLAEKATEGELFASEEIALEDLSETLSSHGYFEPDTWLYEQFCLAMPMRQLCDTVCPGISSQWSREPLIDSRWAGLANFKKQL